MIWHIFRKDCRHLWHMALAVALVNAIRLMILARATVPFVTYNRLSPVRDVSLLLDTILNLANIFLVVLVVQEDGIPGLQQDWLIRPVRRRDLLLGKIAFIVLLIQGPIFVAEVAQSLAYGFPLRQSLGPQLSRSLWMLFALDLPLLAFATLTRNLKEAIGAAAVILVGFELLEGSTIGQAADFAARTGIGWVIDAVRIFWVLLAAGGILALQYGWRKTVSARWLYGSAAVVWVLVQFLPWQPAFALQEQLSSVPSAANPVQIVFEPGSGNGHGEGLGATPRRTNSRTETDAELWVPLHLKGTNDDDLVSADHVTARITGPDGKAIDLGNELEPGKSELWYPFKPLWIPESVYKKLREKRVRLEIDYSLTLLKANPSVSLPALNGNLRDTDAGWCATRKDSSRTAIELGCLIPRRAPCVSWFLESETGKRFVQVPQCDQGYSPYVGRLSDSLSRFGTIFPFRAPLVEDLYYPVNESQLQKARVVIQTYRPVAHFTRQVVIPDLKMSDWVG